MSDTVYASIDVFWAQRSFALFYVAVVTLLYTTMRASPRMYIGKKRLLVYNVMNAGVNMWVAVSLALALDVDVTGGAAPPSAYSPRAMQLVWVHICMKVVDFCDTFIIIATHSWHRLSILHLFHHGTIGMVWLAVANGWQERQGNIFAFGVFANSVVHVFMYTHYALAVYGIPNPMKRVLTAVQCTQFILIIFHGVVFFERAPVFCVLECLYMVAMLVGFLPILVRPSSTSSRATIASRSATRAPKVFLRIGGVVYDVTLFSSKHPGGREILESAGSSSVDDTQECADLFAAFHGRWPRAERLAAMLPVIQPADADALRSAVRTPTMSDQLVPAWRRAGLFNSTIHLTLWTMIACGGVLAGLRLAFSGHVVIGGVILGVSMAQCGFAQHHLGHGGGVGRRGVDIALQTLVFNVFVGASAQWWRTKHSRHHAFTNEIGADGDLDTAPFVAFNMFAAKQTPGFVLRYPKMWFVAALSLYSAELWVRTKRFIFNERLVHEVVALLFHAQLWWWACPSAYHLLCAVAIAYPLQGVYLGLAFSLSHFTMPQTAEGCRDNSVGWVQRQSAGTLDFAAKSAVAAAVFGYLNLQVEHHVAPCMPPSNYSAISKDIRDFLRSTGAPVRDVSLLGAIRLLTAHIDHVAAAELRRRAAARLANTDPNPSSESNTPKRRA